MATLSAWLFDSPDGAAKAENLLLDLQKQQILVVQDAATVSWPQGAKKPTTKELTNTGWVGASMGGMWGLLFGLIFFVPLLGVAIGAGIGALMAHFSDYGISKDFIDSVKAKVVPGTSAIFLMTSNANTEKVAEEVKKAGLKAELIQSNLSDEQAATLRKTFSDAE
ncbi:MAG TPA: DUF1269 domain-containing protein [Thermomicrobiales bacterium]|nr:DUF1269 domain-containing protein [Thermomicrobiales bacterium]